MKEKITDWLQDQTAKIQQKLTVEAIHLGLIDDGELITCKLQVAQALRKMPCELVYPANLSQEEVSHILGLSWDARHHSALRELITDQDSFIQWYDSYISTINNKFRERGLPWRICRSMGSIYLGTIKEGEKPSLGKVRYAPKLVRI